MADPAPIGKGNTGRDHQPVEEPAMIKRPTHNHPLYMYSSICPACNHRIAYQPAPKQRASKPYVWKSRVTKQWHVWTPDGGPMQAASWEQAMQRVRTWYHYNAVV